MLRVALIPRSVINHGEDEPSCSKRKIPDSWRTGWKEKACTSFVLYLEVFKNHLYYLWHVRVLSFKPCFIIHTRLPEHNKSYRKVSRGGGIWSPGMDLWWGIWTGFRPREGGIWPKIFQKFKCPGGCPGGILKLRFDWYITPDDSVYSSKGEPFNETVCFSLLFNCWFTSFTGHPWTLKYLLQRFVSKSLLWPPVFDGCRCDRKTLPYIEQGGFKMVQSRKV